MKLTKNTRLSKKPFKADNGAILSNSTTQYSKPKPYQVDNFGNKTNSPGMDISKATSGTSSSMSPTSFDYSGLATTGMAMGVGAIEKQQASLEAVGKAPSLSGEMGKGALKGASYIAPVALNPAMLSATMGLSALAVPVAAGIGAGVNYVTGNKKINAFNSAKETARKNFLSSQESFAKQNSQYNMLDAVNRGYSTQGSNMSSFYKNGGVVYKQGGSLNPISSDTKLAVGRSHEQGGIKMSEDAEIEGGETVVNKGDHTLVVSDNLVNPITGKTFAKDDLRLAKLARKYEGATTQLAKNSLKHIQSKREELHDLQQQMNGDASDMNTAQNGGKLRPINILTKPVKTSPRPSTHLAENGMKLYQRGGKTKKLNFTPPSNTYTPKDSLEAEGLNTVRHERKYGMVGRQPHLNYGFNDPEGTPPVKNEEEAVKRYVKRQGQDKRFVGEVRNKLNDYNFNSNRSKEDLLLHAAGYITDRELNIDEAGQPGINQKLKDLWAKHGSELIAKANSDKSFISKIDNSKDFAYKTKGIYSKKDNPTQDPNYVSSNYPMWKQRMSEINKVDYSALNKKQPASTTTTSTPSKGNIKTSTSGGRTYTGGSGSLYNINSKGERFIQKPGGQWVKTDKFPDSVEKQFGSSNTPTKLDLDKLDNSTQPFRVGDTNPVDGETIGERVAVDNKYSPTGSKVTDVKDISYKGSSNNQPSTSKGNSTGKNLRKAWDKTKEIGEAALPTLSRAGKLASYTAPALVQYYANKADIARQKGMKIPDAPQQGFQSLAKQNMEADRAAIRKQQADFNAGVVGTLADSQTAALLKANMASKAGDALVGVNQAERNANIATSNAQTEMNLGIDTRNKLAKYQQAGMQLEKDIDLSRRRAGNVAELSANLRDVQNTNRQEKYLDMDSAIKVAGLDERGQAYLTRQGANPRGYWMRKNGGKLTKLRR